MKIEYIQVHKEYESKEIRLQNELNALKQSNELLRKDLEEVNNDNNALRHQLKSVQTITESMKSKENLLNFYKEKAIKCEEILRVQEQNLKVFHLAK